MLAQFASPQGHHTLLTGPTGERWKAVRKSVATGFSTANMKSLYPKIRGACAKVRRPHRCTRWQCLGTILNRLSGLGCITLHCP